MVFLSSFSIKKSINAIYYIFYFYSDSSINFVNDIYFSSKKYTVNHLLNSSKTLYRSNQILIANCWGNLRILILFSLVISIHLRG